MSDPLRRDATFIDYLLWCLDRYPDAVAVIEDDQEITYREIRDRFSRYVRALEAMGFGRGNGLMVLSGNRSDALLVSMAVRALGAWAGSLHPLGSVDDQAFIIEDSEAIGLVFDPTAYEGIAAEVAARVPGLKHVLSLGPSSVGDDLNAAAATFPPAVVTSVAEIDDVCTLAYSGGTTGRPKGVVQRHGTVLEMTHQIIAGWQLPAEVRFLAATPISHAAVCFVLPTWMQGGTIILQKGFDPQAWCDAVARYRATLTFVVPTMLYVLLDHPAMATADLSSLETIVYGAAPMSPTRLAQALDAFGPVFVQLYGQAEAPATVTVLRKDEHDLARPHLMASCGRALPGVTVALLDDDDHEVPTGEVGEICVRGRIVSDGYHKRPELTAETLRNDWLHTGDMARQDADGYFYIVDRKKDMVISGGFNVYPREVEDVLTSHPDVAMAVVIGVPDERWGEAVHALVTARPGATLDPAALIALVREQKGPVYAPKVVDVVAELPLTGLGKPDRKAVRAQFWSTEDRAVH